MKILYFTNLPSPYRVSFFNLLQQYGVDVTVLYERREAADRQKEWTAANKRLFREKFLKSMKLGIEASFSFGMVPYLWKRDFDLFVLGGYGSPSGMLAILLCRLLRIPYVITSDGIIYHEDGGMRRRLKCFLLGGARAALVSSKEATRYLRQYMSPGKPIVKYPFSSLFATDILKAVPSRNEKLVLRRQLGMTAKNIIVSVGNFIPRKGFDLLLQAVDQLPETIEYYFIGGTASEKYLSCCSMKNRRRIHFVNFKKYAELRQYYMAADLFVLPTREDIWGLVVHEAMANGLPVLTTDHCGAGLELIKNDRNGFLVPAGNVPALVTAIDRIFKNTAHLSEVAESALKTSREYTLENMTTTHLRFFQDFSKEKGKNNGCC